MIFLCLLITQSVIIKNSPLTFCKLNQAAANALKNGYNPSLNSTTSSEGTHDGDADVNDDDVPAKYFAICALDVLSGVLSALT